MKIPFKVALSHLLLASLATLAAGTWAAAADVALVSAKNSRVAAINSTDLAKIIKTTHRWSDGRDLMVVLTDPSSPQMRVVAEKLLSLTAEDFRRSIEAANRDRLVFVVVSSDDEALKMLQSNPGAIALVNVYSINSSIDVWKIDGRLPLEHTYLLHSQ